jgi:lipopolysaccharide transport system ATP-binding protein
MSSNDIAISIKNLSKCYEVYATPRDRLKQFVLPRLQRLMGQQPRQYFSEFWALNNVSFEVKKGETVGIIGRNGSGKSTLLQMVCGTLSPTGGIVNTIGRVAALLELGAGFNMEFTGRENVILNAAILGFPREKILAKMDEILIFAELGEFSNQSVKTYSSGMFMRLAFSTAIHVEPAVLVVDEALSVGDARFQAKCMRRIKDIKKQGTAILFVSHDIASVRSLCDRAIWLDNGKIVDQGTIFPVTGRYMEFMFKDEQFASDNRCEIAIPQSSKPAVLHTFKTEIDIQNQVEVKSPDRLLTTESNEKISELMIDSRPVAHWGSDKGIIVSASVCDRQGNRQNVFLLGDVLRVIIEVRIPLEIPREYLSFAFSIKDMKGTDLVVSTTHDFGNKPLPDVERLRVSFQMNNLLVTGMYLLVVAVENRQNRDIHYYEYIEGAHYFSSLSCQQFFGIFHPSIVHEVQRINE